MSRPPVEFSGTGAANIATTVERVAPLVEPFATWLEARLRAEAGANGAFGDFAIVAAELPPSGQSGTTVLFVVQWSEDGRLRQEDIVLRVQPGGVHIFHRPDIIREFAVMQQIARHSAVPVPRVLWQEPDAAVLGAPFIVMSRVRGTVPQGKPSINLVGWLPQLQPHERRRLYENGIDALASLHAIDSRQSHPFLWHEQGGEAGLDAYLTRFDSWYRWAARGRAYTLIDAAVDYLRRHSSTVVASAPTLVWGDARMGNVVFGDDFRVAALLDWEVASIAPPDIDVGYWLMMDDFHSSANGVQRLPGSPDRSETLARYEKMSGREVANPGYFELLGATQMAVTLIRQSDSRVAAGLLSPDSRLAHENAFTQMIARQLGLAVPDLSEEFLAHRQIRKP